MNAQETPTQLDFPGSFGSPTGDRGMTRLRSDSDVSDQSRQSFLDNVPARASFTFKAQQRKEARLMAEDEKFDKFRLKLKAISLFFVSFSCFILLNASIGASSAPFYDKYTDCSKYSLTSECKELQKYTSALYGFEFVGSLLLVIHGLLGMTLLEYIKKMWLIRTLQVYTKVALFLYISDAILRCSIYFKILNLVKPNEENNHSQDFGGFLAVYCDNDALGVIITGILIGIYSCCFLSTCFMWRLTNELHSTANQVEEDKDKSARKFSTSSSKSRSQSAVSMEESQQTSVPFEDFDYNKERAKQASQNLLSINAADDAEDDLEQNTSNQAMPGDVGQYTGGDYLSQPYGQITEETNRTVDLTVDRTGSVSLDQTL